MSHLAVFFAVCSAIAVSAQSGRALTTRFWDCCKGVCSGANVALSQSPVASCDLNDNVLNNPRVASGCDGGSAFMCTSLSPFGMSESLAYGFAASNIVNSTISATCCSCYKLTFNDGSIKGKQMIVQSISSSYNIDDNQFDLLIPGGGVTEAQGCAKQWGNVTTWGATFGGVFNRDSCGLLPNKFQGGCNWRFDWLRGIDNPSATFEHVACPKELTDLSKCRRNDEAPSPSSTRKPDPTTSNTASPSQSGLPHGAQCGGRTYNGPTKCADNLQCIFVTDSLYQCLNPGESPITSTARTSSSSATRRTTSTTKSSSTTTKSTPPTTTSTTPPGQVAAWGQCGGQGYTGSTDCVDGYSCTMQSQWYSQCKPDNDGSDNSGQ